MVHFLTPCQHFSTAVHHFKFLPAVPKCSNVSVPLSTLIISVLWAWFLVRLVGWFLMNAMLVGGKWYLVTVLICISLTTNDVEHVVTCP